MLDFNFILYALVVIAMHLAVIILIMYIVYWIIKFILRIFEKYWFPVVCIISLIIAWALGIFDSLISYLLY
ncbi:MAG: hypothetical protein IJV50_08380 [Lachnospiraceae bacterium]|nr:hypothetical protein [Lachnospiraceae bacterium]